MASPSAGPAMNHGVFSGETIDGAMMQLRLNDDLPVIGGGGGAYLEYSGLPDCSHYPQSGMCVYGVDCYHTQPDHVDQRSVYIGELPQREGQPDCQFYLRTGTCKFGAICKYHHPRDKFNGLTVQFNSLGLPMREGERSCAYYMRRGSCKFGSVCKFNHPELATAAPTYLPAGSYIYGSPTPVATPGLSMYGSIPSWPLSRGASSSNARVAEYQTYLPVFLPPNQPAVHMLQNWTPSSPGNVVPVDFTATTQLYGSQNHFNVAPNPTDRPDQPDCQHYVMTGSCKYGPNCKYRHPIDRNKAPVNLGPHGLPFRPGQPMCSLYGSYARCKFGINCKFDHPMVYFQTAFPVPDTTAFLPDQAIPPFAPTRSNTSTPETLRHPDLELNHEKMNKIQEAKNINPSE